MRKKRMYSVFCMSVVCISMLAGCATMRSSERVAYEALEPRLEATGLEKITDKDPALAGTLNLLPGVGNAYLGQWGAFVGNLLFWPLSVVWGIPQAAIDAGTINKLDTLNYYSFGLGKKELEKKEKALSQN